MKRYETLETLFSKVDLSFAQKILNEPFHPAGSPGRPQRKPMGIFKAERQEISADSLSSILGN
jgi:hypothetical protein